MQSVSICDCNIIGRLLLLLLQDQLTMIMSGTWHILPYSSVKNISWPLNSGCIRERRHISITCWEGDPLSKGHIGLSSPIKTKFLPLLFMITLFSSVSSESLQAHEGWGTGAWNACVVAWAKLSSFSLLEAILWAVGPKF